MEEKITPMMKQYLEMKRQHENDILFFRMGDFYEMFFDDAKVASKILDIALTARQNDVPMCGIPYHAAESYISRLIRAGKRVAVCEQLETVPTTGTIVRREVVRVITPGTLVESNLIAGDDNNFLCSVYLNKDELGLAFVDVSTGDFHYMTSPKSFELFRAEMSKYMPREVIFHSGSMETDSMFLEYIKSRNIPVGYLNEWNYDREYMTDVICRTLGVHGTKGLGLDSDCAIVTAGSILQYLNDTQKTALGHIKNPRHTTTNEIMHLDEATVSNLELVRNQQDGTRDRTLFSLLNTTRTPMGRRALERNLLQPLTVKEKILERLDAVEFFYSHRDVTAGITSLLKDILDIERLISRFMTGRMLTRNFIAMKQSLAAAMKVKHLLREEGMGHASAAAFHEGMADLGALIDRISSTIEDEPALTPEHGRVIRGGFSAELDRLYELKQDGKKWVLEYQENEKSRLGINTLRVKYNRILGYYIEISKGQAASAPQEYYRKQTLVGAERFTTDELMRFEADILGSSGRITEIEEREIESLRQEILLHSKEIQATAESIGYLDFICGLAVAAAENRFVRPSINDQNYISIKSGRHPVVEKYYTREVFIPNDILLDDRSNIINIITGPNMAGKSTYIRMCAILQLMAQAGSFVPAESADLSVADRIFTRIGASDNISRGESTFLVEMNETAGILNNATGRSLIIMDEVGRGTSTYDGLSIAWGVVEYIHRYIKARTLFATHYHELTRLGGKEGIVNYNVLVKETLSSVEFLHRVVPGSADKSYGIHVARLAGLPKTVVSRAAKILEKLEKTGSDKKIEVDETGGAAQLEIFNASNHIIMQTLEKIDIDNLTPVEALNELSRLKKLV